MASSFPPNPPGAALSAKQFNFHRLLSGSPTTKGQRWIHGSVLGLCNKLTYLLKDSVPIAFHLQKQSAGALTRTRWIHSTPSEPLGVTHCSLYLLPLYLSAFGRAQAFEVFEGPRTCVLLRRYYLSHSSQIPIHVHFCFLLYYFGFFSSALNILFVSCREKKRQSEYRIPSLTPQTFDVQSHFLITVHWAVLIFMAATAISSHFSLFLN